MMIKVGIWKRLTELEKRDLLLHHYYHDRYGNVRKERLDIKTSPVTERPAQDL